jgi:RNA polymerase primary sigma factor
VIDLSPEKVREIQKLLDEPVSRSSGIEEDSYHSNYIDDADDPESFVMLQEQLDGVLHTLSDREREVVQLRFGLIDGHPWKLDDVALKFGVMPERICRIELKTLSKLSPRRA